MRHQRLVFPTFNAILLGLVGLGLSYLLGNSFVWVLGTVLGGLLFGLLLEFALKPIQWLYRFRLWIATVIQVPFVLFGLGTWVFVGQQTMPSSYAICCASPADFGADYENLSIPMPDGIEIASWYIPSQNGAFIIFLHGINANRLATLWFAEQVYSEGYGVLLYDQRALAESGGSMQSFGWLDIGDLSSIIDYLVAEKGIDTERLGVVGVSLGGHIGLPATAQDARIQALWVDGVAAQHYGDFPTPQNFSEQIQRFYYGLLDRTLSLRLGLPIEAIIDLAPQIAPRPVLLVANGQTQLEERTNGAYAQAIGASAEVWLIADAGHTEGSVKYADEYRQRLLDFFNQHLQETDE